MTIQKDLNIVASISKDLNMLVISRVGIDALKPKTV
jgi:hypothetical protein